MRFVNLLLILILTLLVVSSRTLDFQVSTDQGIIYVDPQRDYLVDGGITYKLIPLSFDQSIQIKRERDLNTLEKYELAHPPTATFLSKELNEVRKHLLGDEHKEEVDGETFWIYIVVSICLTIFSGMMSGLSTGYFSIDELVLELKLKNGTPEEKRQASRILPIVQTHHQLMVTLLVANAAAMEALPIFLDAIMPAYIAIIVSVTLVLFFGEIIPQAVCAGPKQIQIASALAPFTRVLIFVTSPLSWPISKILDKILGKHSRNRFMNSDLKTLIEMHSAQALEALTEFAAGVEGDMGLKKEQTKLILQAIEMNNDTVRTILKPYDNVYALSEDEEVTNKTLQKIGEKGFSRVPIFRGKDKHNVRGILLLKNLVGLNPLEKRGTIKSLKMEIRMPLVVPPSMPLGTLLKEFQKGASHLAFVTNNVDGLKELMKDPKKAERESMLKKTKLLILGIATLEDLFEHILQANIDDEGDFDEKKKMHPARRMFSLKSGLIQENEKNVFRSTSNTDTSPAAIQRGYNSTRNLMTQATFDDKKNEIMSKVLNDTGLGEIIEKNESKKKSVKPAIKSSSNLSEQLLLNETTLNQNPFTMSEEISEDRGFKEIDKFIQDGSNEKDVKPVILTNEEKIEEVKKE